MASITRARPPQNASYPTSDGRPMAETDRHREIMMAMIKILQAYYALDPNVYVSGNLLVFYEPGNRRRHISPDVFVVKGVPKHERLNYLIWEEGKGPDIVIELTSKSTKDEDMVEKFHLYQDNFKTPEYFLFDPTGDYLTPVLQGYRLQGDRYERIVTVEGRLPSEVLGLHLEQNGSELRLYDPSTGRWLPTPEEAIEEAQMTAEREKVARLSAEEEIARLRAELAALRHAQTP